MSKASILIVEDDPSLAEVLDYNLKHEGYETRVARDGQQGLRDLRLHTPDLVILDLMLPGEDGLSIARRLQSNHRLPIVMISARGEELDRIVGLEVGADDYLPKPFNPRELLARIRAVLRRSAPHPEPEPDQDKSADFGDFRFDSERRALYRNDTEVELSRAEFDLLHVFLQRPNRVLSRDLIMDCLSGGDRDPFDRSIDVRVTRLRHKIEDDPSDPKFIRTVWGVGYQFTPNGDLP